MEDYKYEGVVKHPELTRLEKLSVEEFDRVGTLDEPGLEKVEKNILQQEILARLHQLTKEGSSQLNFDSLLDDLIRSELITYKELYEILIEFSTNVMRLKEEYYTSGSGGRTEDSQAISALYAKVDSIKGYLELRNEAGGNRMFMGHAENFDKSVRRLFTTLLKSELTRADFISSLLAKIQ